MKKVLLLLTVIVALLMLGVAIAQAGGGPNGTYVHFGQGSYDCHTFWLATRSGLVHEWRNECAPYAGVYSLHLVFKPTYKFASADCDDYGYLGSFLWTANLGYYTDYTDDEADLSDFVTNGNQYWVCFYDWSADWSQELAE